MFDDIQRARRKAESLGDAALRADETLENVENTLDDVDRRMNRVENLERDLIDTVNSKFADLTLKMLVIELKLYGLVFFGSVAVGGHFLSQGDEVLGRASLALAGIVVASTFLTTYRYLGRDFVVDLLRIALPFVANPDLEKKYRLQNR